MKILSKNIKIAILLIVFVLAATSCNNSPKDTTVKESTEKSVTANEDESSKSTESSSEKKEATTDDKLKASIEADYNKALGMFFNGDYQNAIEIADEIIKKDVTFYKAYNIKGIALCFSHNFDEGMKNIDKCLSINPSFGYGRFNKALAYELYGHYEESLEWYDKALEVENYVWSYYGKASIYGRRGDVENTVKYLKIAVEMDSNVKNEARNEKDFDKVRNSNEFKKLVN
ncbi:tetratricopeptide repeat protein [Clostridium homopropionicum DSM 5847]|uniref:Tetratricopeptide repeat protein n=1 Tax=Clostridium homopropionicum DSM 5847 TaxID=1121318 RepID=A0A0L6Z5P4_9CLOT|nr:hypothetical protein [Clostridium homopropionicum]KOA18289.1 tetratricopeptide repeat protein [Clostridium homopropionicum DSM 5847]SFF69738.1 Tetratricopeptide repeat-containing protein [Clostridium homopropionicum]